MHESVQNRNESIEPCSIVDWINVSGYVSQHRGTRVEADRKNHERFS